MAYSSRWLEGPLGAARTRGKVRLVFGARQTGKSTLLAKIVGERVIAVNLQDPRERLRYERAPGTLAAQLEAAPREPRTVFIDEIQKVPGLLEEVQFIADRYPRRFEFFLTGSSARRLRRAASNLLPGRAHVFDLFPLVACERRGAGASTVLPLAMGAGREAGFPGATLDELLLYGDLPGVARETAGGRRATLEAYADHYLQEEIRQEALVRDVGSFAAFLQAAAEQSGAIVNLEAISRTTGIPARTLKTHYDVLVDTFVGYWIPPFTAGPSRRTVQTTPRFVFFDLGVRNAAAGLAIDRNLLRVQGPQLLEQRVQLELLRRCRYTGRGHRVTYWRTRHGREVDVVLETPREIVPIEVKWTERPVSHDARHVEAFLDEHSRRARRGLVVCRTPAPLKLSDRVTAIPGHLL
jgi:predicted AAA+ superfamily ATPase